MENRLQANLSQSYAADNGAASDQSGRRAVLALADGPEGIRQTLYIMRRLVRESQFDDEIRKLAESIIAGVPGKEFYRQAKAIHDWIFSNIKYTLDNEGFERIAGPQYTLAQRSGDCDDMAVLEAALLKAIGHPARFVAMAQEPDAFCHVYIETKIGSNWVPSDPTEPNGFGWAPPDAVSRLYRDA